MNVKLLKFNDLDSAFLWQNDSKKTEHNAIEKKILFLKKIIFPSF